MQPILEQLGASRSCSICNSKISLSLQILQLPATELVCPCLHTQIVLASKIPGNQHRFCTCLILLVITYLEKVNEFCLNKDNVKLVLASLYLPYHGRHS